VIMMTLMPACRHSRTAPSTSFLGGSNMPTQPTKVRSDWAEETRGTTVTHLAGRAETDSISCDMDTVFCFLITFKHRHHLIIPKDSHVLQVEAVDVRGRVPGCHGEATQHVSARCPLLHIGQELLSNRRGQRDTRSTADPDIIAPLQHALWSSLRDGEEEDASLYSPVHVKDQLGLKETMALICVSLPKRSI